jgi:hypothetical protein
MVSSHPVTMLSGGGSARIPREVDIRNGQAESKQMEPPNAKRFKIFMVPTCST